MNSQPNAGTSFTDEVAEVIRRLSSLARRTSTGPGGELQRHDFAEVFSIALTATAANLGGTEELLAGRPESWEADLVRQIVNGTVSDGELHRYRTEPLMLLLDPESIFEDRGLRELFDEEDRALCEDYFNGTEPADGGANDSAVNARRGALEAAYHAGLDAYFRAYSETICAVAKGKGLTVPVEVKRVVDFPAEPHSDPLVEELHAAARSLTPVPTAIFPQSAGQPSA